MFDPFHLKSVRQFIAFVTLLVAMLFCAAIFVGCSANSINQQSSSGFVPSNTEIQQMEGLKTDYMALVLQYGVALQPGDRLFVSVPAGSQECLQFADQLMQNAISSGALNAGIYEYPLGISGMAETDEGLLSGSSSKTCYVIINGTPMAASDQIKWTQIGVATQEWADQVFSGNGELAAEVAVDQRVPALWKKIFQCSGLWPFDAQENNPGANTEANANSILTPDSSYWSKQLGYLNGYASYLNETIWTDLVVESGVGTDLHVPMDSDSKFYSISCLPNETFYVTPAPEGITGELVSSAPTVYQGEVIDGLKLTFENGSLVSYSAEEGAAILERFVGGGSIVAYRIGLVPYNSYVNKTGLVYYNDLFDSNRLCSVSLANLETGELLSVFIGTDDFSIYGVSDEGWEIQFFEAGNWIPD